MAVYQQPGVYVQEVLSAVPPTVGASTAAIGAFLGAINQGPLTPTVVTKWSDFVNLYGGFVGDATDNLRLAVKSFLVDNNGGACAVQRVLGTGTATSTQSFYDSSGTGGTAGSAISIVISAANPGAWGNKIYVDIVKTTATAATFTLVVHVGDGTSSTIVETWPNLSMSSTDPRYVVNFVNSNSKYVVVSLPSSNGTTASSPANVPVSQTAQPLASGVDATGGQTATSVAGAVNSFDTITQTLVLNAPGITDATNVNTILAYAATRGDVFVVIDPIADTVANQLTLAASYTSTSYGAVYYPQITVADPTSSAPGVVRTINPGGAVVAQYLVTDHVTGPFKAPAGIKTRIGGAVSVAALTNTNLASMNSAAAPVNAIRFVPGSGIVIMGARTLQPGYSTMYVPVRRSLQYIEKALTNLTQFAIFEPNDQRLWRQLSATVGNFLTDYWRQGGLSGSTPAQAFYAVCDSTNNTSVTINNGELHIDVGVALERPAEFVVIRISQYDGGTTVTTA